MVIGSSKRSCKRKLRYIGDVSSEHFSSPISAERSFDIARRKALAYRQQNKNLMKQVNRLKSKLKTYRSVMNDLKKKELLSEQAATKLTV
jgi:intergrase/recombinase